MLCYAYAMRIDIKAPPGEIPAGPFVYYRYCRYMVNVMHSEGCHGVEPNGGFSATGCTFWRDVNGSGGLVDSGPVVTRLNAEPGKVFAREDLKLFTDEAILDFLTDDQEPVDVDDEGE